MNERAAVKLRRGESISRHDPRVSPRMNRYRADPRLVWLASVLAAATLVIFIAYQA
jgi:hypothetical protein